MDHPPIDKIFAENLGLSIGGCVRDLADNLFNKEVAEAASIRLNPIPFCGSRNKHCIRAFWAAALQGIGIWTAINDFPEFCDEKLLRKVIFNMQQLADETLARRVLHKLSPEDIERYGNMRRLMMRTGLNPLTDKETLARAFYAELHGIRPDDVPDSRVTALALHVGISASIFSKLNTISKKSPNSWLRDGGASKNKKK